MAIHSSGQTVFSLSHIEGITLGAGEEIDEVDGGANGMGADGIGEVRVRFGKSFYFPFPYFVLFVLMYFTFHVV